jgi:hypothetical protein
LFNAYLQDGRKRIDASDLSKHGRSIRSEKKLNQRQFHQPRIRECRDIQPTFEAGARLRKPRELMMNRSHRWYSSPVNP